jgi:hypothetical protein
MSRRPSDLLGCRKGIWPITIVKKGKARINTKQLHQYLPFDRKSLIDQRHAAGIDQVN